MFLFRIFFVALVALLVACVTCKKTSNALKLLEKESKKASKCRRFDLRSVMRLREDESWKELLPCVVKALDSSTGDAVLWTMLGEVFDHKNEKSKANVCFRESSRLVGKLSKFIKKWYFLGPFTIGKNEVDGDPIEDFGGIDNVTKHRWTKKAIYYSELLNKGELKWSTIDVKSEQESINVAPPAEWNELILSLQSIGIAEWQGWIVGDFIVNEDGSYLFQCLGASLVYVDESFFPGDLYRRHRFWHPIYLKRGLHKAKVKLRAKGPLSFNFRLLQVQEKNMIEILPPTFLPDLVQGKIFGRFISFELNNLHSSNSVKVTKVSLISQSSNMPYTVSLSGDINKFAVAPGQIKPIVFEIGYKYESTESKPLEEDCREVTLNLKISFNGGKEQKVNINLRCRKVTESFLFTFLDHDGSVQHGAVIPPLKGCESKTCPVLVSLHGTTVPPQNQADSYKRMENGQWVFGVDNLWLLAPTRHGAHNWEGPGTLTTVRALECLAQYTQEASWIEYKADDKRMVIAGHSMGGHGAWQLGTHYPDQALALISAAGWIRKEDYGDSNLFFRHDVSTSHVDPIVKATMEACVAENDADKHVSNLHGLPIMIRVGAADRTVHPYYSRRMYRLLRQQRSNVTFDEIPKKEHWWWDTYNTNDGGVTNDPVIRGFAIKHAENAGTSKRNHACDPNNKNKECDADISDPARKYQQQEHTLDRNYVGEFTLLVYNPASITGVRGVRVLQQLVPFRQSTIQIKLTPGAASLTTVNVARLSLSEPAVSPVYWSQRDIKIDDTPIKSDDLHGFSGKRLSFCKIVSEGWKICENESLESEVSRGPLNMGPARRVAESPFLIVTGTTSDPSTVSRLRQGALYIANQFYLTSDTIAHVITDKELDQTTASKFNLIVIGGPDVNSWAGGFHENVPLKFRENNLILNNCQFTSARTGAVFLAPHSGSRLALVLTANSLEGLQDVILLATPTILPMARSPFSNLVPDFIVTGPDFSARGPGGYLCAGFWGNSWEYRRDISSCSC